MTAPKRAIPRAAAARDAVCCNAGRLFRRQRRQYSLRLAASPSYTTADDGGLRGVIIGLPHLPRHAQLDSMLAMRIEMLMPRQVKPLRHYHDVPPMHISSSCAPNICPAYQLRPGRHRPILDWSAPHFAHEQTLPAPVLNYFAQIFPYGREAACRRYADVDSSPSPALDGRRTGVSYYHTFAAPRSSMRAVYHRLKASGD